MKAKPHRKPASKYAMRKAALEAMVIKKVREDGGFSVFWATESLERARAIDRLHWKLGIIAPKTGRGKGQFPWCGYKIKKHEKRDSAGARTRRGKKAPVRNLPTLSRHGELRAERMV
jgi:hypothetical protein